MSIGLESIHEMRRKAPAHFWAKADNARFSAFLLSQSACAASAEQREKVGYYGDPGIATWETFRREAALALELIVKAVIARKLQRRCTPPHVTRVRTTHDLPSLWLDAGLPNLDAIDRRRLLLARRILVWAGRYAAPKSDVEFYQEEANDEALRPPSPPGLKIERYLDLDWDNFDRLYTIASTELFSLGDL